jgi:hypothetical protein
MGYFYAFGPSGFYSGALRKNGPPLVVPLPVAGVV